MNFKTMPCCEYRHVFGDPGEGVHSIRLFGVAIFDVVLTVAVSMVLSRFAFGWPWLSLRTLAVVVIAFLLGVACHRMFCVRTTVDRLLWGSAP